MNGPRRTPWMRLLVRGAALAGVALLLGAVLATLGSRHRMDAARTRLEAARKDRAGAGAVVPSIRPISRSPRAASARAGEATAEAKAARARVPPVIAELLDEIRVDIRRAGDGPFPSRALNAWRRTVAQSNDERLPEPPPALIAWLDANRHRLDEASALGIDEHGLRRVLEADAGVAAWRGDHALAERRVERAWEMSDLPQEPCLGALRATRVAVPDTWIERFDALDLRARRAEGLLAEAEEMMAVPARFEGASTVPRWVPAPARALVDAVDTIDRRWWTASRIETYLDLRELIREAPPCTDLASAIDPDWQRDQWFSRVLPASRRLRMAYSLALQSDVEAGVLLTRAVLAARSGSSSLDPCGLASLADAADGRVTITLPESHPMEIPWDRRAPRDYTIDPVPPDRPVLASAPRR